MVLLNGVFSAKREAPFFMGCENCYSLFLKLPLDKALPLCYICVTLRKSYRRRKTFENMKLDYKPSKQNMEKAKQVFTLHEAGLTFYEIADKLKHHRVTINRLNSIYRDFLKGQNEKE